jgi:hypothetical protein
MVTGACTDYHVDAAKFPRPDRSGCRAILKLIRLRCPLKVSHILPLL